MNLRFFLDNAWRWITDLPELEIKDALPYNTAPDIETIKKRQYSELFVKLMNNRMIIGYFRYGDIYRRFTSYNYIASAKRRIELYQLTGNKECLVDAANLLRMEFDHPQHPKAHFEAVDDGEHSDNIK